MSSRDGKRLSRSIAPAADQVKVEEYAAVLMICHGVQVLAAAGLTAGKRLTRYEHVRVEAEQAGATHVSDRTVCRMRHTGGLRGRSRLRAWLRACPTLQDDIL
ncbi:MAG: DJ-1/PfpI family protein [Bryobacteraceae bacterium]|jgi:phosphoribosylformylglycinamidine (FGAM) synthase-like amidotransferase family enzyme